MSSPANSKSTHTQPMTPLRNNYAAPNTPITSVKRPRQSIESRATPAPTTPAGKQPFATAASPMHPPKPLENVEETSWVGRKVDALFSPVLHMFHTTTSHADATEENVVTDEDVAMVVPPEEAVYLEQIPLEAEAVVVVTKSTQEEEGDLEEDPSSDDDDDDDFNPYLFIKSLPRYAAVRHLRPNIALPPKDPHDPPVTLVLDLDETLVHCTVEACTDADLTFPVVFHGISYQVHVRLRPFLFDFLEAVYDKFEVVVFTASQRVYADELLDRIDPTGKYIKHRMFRESCLAVEGNFLKDLTVLGRDLSKAVLVDNSPHAFGYQVDNGIPIESWFDDRKDTELLKLESFCRELHHVSDVREVVRNKFMTYQRVNES